MSEENTKSTDEQVENSSIEKPAEDLPVIKETTEEAVPAQELPKQPSEPDPLPEEIIFDMDEVAQEDGYTLKERTDMEAKYTETMKIFRSGELVTGKIVAITDSDIAVDIGFKSEGSIPVEEFENLNSMKVGDDIEVLIDSIEERKRQNSRAYGKISIIFIKLVRWSKRRSSDGLRVVWLSIYSALKRSCPVLRLMFTRFVISMLLSMYQWISASSRLITLVKT